VRSRDRLTASQPAQHMGNFSSRFGVGAFPQRLRGLHGRDSSVVRVLRLPLVAVGFVVDQLRRLPGSRFVGRYSFQIALVLTFGAAAALLVWGLERAPQRFTLAQLAAGELSPMQSWIIVTGELTPATSQTGEFRYWLTDPAAPNASMIVVSSFELPVGWTTLSGTYDGTREVVPAGLRWIGHMRAEPVLAQEQPPPWAAILLGLAGLSVGFAGRVSYPTFFDEKPGRVLPRSATLTVGIRGANETHVGRVVPGTLRLHPGARVMLQTQGTGEQALRLHSAHTSVDTGELRWLSGSQPALRVKQAKGDLDIIFASRDERDAALAALTADAEAT